MLFIKTKQKPERKLIEFNLINVGKMMLFVSVLISPSTFGLGKCLHLKTALFFDGDSAFIMMLHIKFESV